MSTSTVMGSDCFYLGFGAFVIGIGIGLVEESLFLSRTSQPLCLSTADSRVGFADRIPLDSFSKTPSLSCFLHWCAMGMPLNYDMGSDTTYYKISCASRITIYHPGP